MTLKYVGIMLAQINSARMDPVFRVLLFKVRA